jgi:hypothetical protein
MLLLDSSSSYCSDIFIKSLSRFLILPSSSSEDRMGLSMGAGFKLIIYLGPLSYAFSSFIAFVYVSGLEIWHMVPSGEEIMVFAIELIVLS